ncbi:MAG: 30S ribosomal protein S6e [Candidatus Altiarchaeia archaeon]
MEFKVVVSDPESGKSYQREVKDEKASRIAALKLGDVFDGVLVGLVGYTLKITGGSDKAGFPMKKGVQGMKRAMVLMDGGVGYKPLTAVRVRKRVRGEKIAEDIAQINTSVTKKGGKGIEELLGITAAEPKEGETAAAPAEKKEKKAGKNKK